tara:strand:+ start:82501 stop:83607 length:1107 start_codon:yes stop_codon:yes gene_type:complete
MSINPIILSIPVYFVLISIEWIADAVLNQKKYRFGDVIGNIGAGITEQVTGLFAKVFLIGLYTFIYSNYRLFEIQHTWYWGVILFIGVDFLYYWAHRKSHEINLFWVGHIVHHQSEDYNLSVALRQGTFQKFFTAPFFWPLALLGFDPVWFLFMSAFVTLYQFWIHTEYIQKLGWFEYLFNTPSHHRVHHGRDSKYLDKNHGGTFIIWDRLFGTFQEEEETPNYGVTNQLGTFNPINATLIPVRDIALKVAESNGLANKLKAIFYGPGWSVNNEKKTKEITAKYNSKISLSRILYTAFQFLLLIGISSYTLFSYSQLPLQNALALALFVLFSIWSIGTLTDNKPYAIKLEIIRILMGLVGVWYLTQFG